MIRICVRKEIPLLLVLFVVNCENRHHHPIGAGKMKNAFVLIVLCVSLGLYAAPEEKTGTWGTPEAWLTFWGFGGNIPYYPGPLVSGVDTILWVGTGFADYNSYYYFDPLTGQPVTGDQSLENLQYKITYLPWTLGIAQGIFYNDATNRNFLEFYTYYRGTLTFNRSIEGGDAYLLQSDLPDRNGFLMNSVIFGLALDDKQKFGENYLFSGYNGEITVESSPDYVNLLAEGKVDFIRLNANANTYIPLFDTERDSDFPMGLMLKNYFAIDFLSGNQIPYNLLSTFGGKYLKSGLGYGVRGVDEKRFAADIKALINTSLQWNFLGLEITDGAYIMPAMIAYFDLGWYKNTALENYEGFVYTTGLELHLNLLNILQVGVGYDYWINGDNFFTQQFPEIAFRFNFRH
jgi:hypothetical protein